MTTMASSEIQVTVRLHIQDDLGDLTTILEEVVTELGDTAHGRVLAERLVDAIVAAIVVDL